MTFGLFGKKQSQAPDNTSSQPVVLNRLQEITGNDADMYRAMSRLLFLDPKRITMSLEDAVSQATNFEAAGNKTRAEVWYRIAGGICLYRGDVSGVQKFFEKASSMASDSKPDYKTVASRASEAIVVAQKYYENL